MDPMLLPADGGEHPFNTPASAALRQQRGRGVEAERLPLVMPAVQPGRVRFRSKDGRRHVLISLLIPHYHEDSPDFDQAYKAYRRWTKRQIDKGLLSKDELFGQKLLIKRELDIIDKIGGYMIRFRPIAGRHECVYETSDPDIADYIRWRIARGDYPDIYEETRDFELVVNGKTIKLRPSSMADQAILANYFAGLDRGDDVSVSLEGAG